MKKTFPYIIISILVSAIVILMLIRDNKKRRIPDQRITLHKRDKIPYGTFATFKNLRYIFPHAEIIVNRDEPAFWDSISRNGKNQALLIIAPRFYANESELENLIEFAKEGNDVFISARELSMTAQELMKLRSSISFGPFEESDSLEVKLEHPPFGKPASYIYPGKKFDSYLYKYDSSITTILGRTFDDEPNFIRLRTGDGNIYLHLAPLAFSNYFVLHKKNIEYYEKTLSVIPATTKKVIWDEYFYFKFRDGGNENEKSWLSVLLKYDSFRAAFWTLVLLLIVYTLLEMRRKQRIIPVMKKPKNESLDFVKTIGRLYYDKKDHVNLCRKMASYFLEHVRTRYKLPTAVLDNKFVKALHYKSGYPEKEVSEIVSFIGFIETAPAVSDNQLAAFYKQMEEFYRKT